MSHSTSRRRAGRVPLGELAPAEVVERSVRRQGKGRRGPHGKPADEAPPPHAAHVAPPHAAASGSGSRAAQLARAVGDDELGSACEELQQLSLARGESATESESAEPATYSETQNAAATALRAGHGAAKERAHPARAGQEAGAVRRSDAPSAAENTDFFVFDDPRGRFGHPANAAVAQHTRAMTASHDYDDKENRPRTA